MINPSLQCSFIINIATLFNEFPPLPITLIESSERGTEGTIRADLPSTRLFELPLKTVPPSSIIQERAPLEVNWIGCHLPKKDLDRTTLIPLFMMTPQIQKEVIWRFNVTHFKSFDRRYMPHLTIIPSLFFRLKKGRQLKR